MCTCTVSLFAFTMLKTFPLLMVSISLYGCLWMFACVSIFGIVFTVFAVTETKGSNLDTIEQTNINQLKI